MLCLALAAAAPVLPGVGAESQRVTEDATVMPWRALARLQVPGESRCTAFLIAPRIALTAAHCLVGRRTGRDVQAQSVHVLTGYSAGRFARHSIAASYRRGADGLDAASVTLAEPIGIDVLPLAPADPAVGTAVMLGGYNQDRAEVIAADIACHVIATQPGRVFHDCAGTRGTSGAPLLARAADGSWQVVGLQVAGFTERTGGVAIPPSLLRPLSAPAD